MNLQENIRRILREDTEMLVFIFDPKTNKVIGFNLTYNSEEFNNILHDKNGRSMGYGFGQQKDDFGNPIKFDSLEDVQKWYSDKTEKHLQKQTQNQKYSDLSYIANNLRKIDDLDYQTINRGSCFKFAKEISKLGYNKFTFIFSEEEQEVIHVYVKLTNNLYFDANGFHTKKEIKNEYYVGEDTEMYDSGIDELDNFSELDTYGCLTTIPISNDVWKKVIQVIKKSKMNLQESIRRILRETLESRWNKGDYDYQHGYCHYFAYDIIGRLKKLYPNKNIRYYLILADEVYDYDEGEVEQSYLIHAYIKIDDLYLDSNGFTTEDEIEKRTQDWYDRQLEELPEDYRIDIWHDEYNKIPKYFFNNQFCNTSIIKRDIETFLSHPEVRELLKIIE